MRRNTKKKNQKQKKNFRQAWIGVSGVINLLMLSILLIPLVGSSFMNQVTLYPDYGAAIQLRKVLETEDYVELTTEELQQFPALQAALQQLNAGGGNLTTYETSERNATAPDTYLVNKYCGNTVCTWNRIFKYGEDFYSFYLYMPGPVPLTSIPSPSVSELSFTEVFGLLLSGLCIYSGYHYQKRCKTNRE